MASHILIWTRRRSLLGGPHHSTAPRPPLLLCLSLCMCAKYQQSLCESGWKKMQWDWTWKRRECKASKSNLHTTCVLTRTCILWPCTPSLLGYQFEPSIMVQWTVKGQAWPRLPTLQSVYMCMVPYKHASTKRLTYKIKRAWSLTHMTFPSFCLCMCHLPPLCFSCSAHWSTQTSHCFLLPLHCLNLE